MRRTQTDEARGRASKQRAALLLGLALLTLLLASCSTATSTSSAPLHQLAPRVSIDEVMRSWINPASFAVWDAARESLAPTTDSDWRTLEDHAVQLIASGTWITLGGTGPMDQEWVEADGWLQHAEDMTVAAEKARDAARAKDLDAFLEAGNLLVESCEGCHLDFR